MSALFPEPAFMINASLSLDAGQIQLSKQIKIWLGRVRDDERITYVSDSWVLLAIIWSQ